MDVASPQSPNTSGNPGQSTSTATSGGAQPDVFTIKKDLDSKAQELHGTRKHLDKVTKDYEGFKKETQADRDLLKKLKGVFQPEAAPAPEAQYHEALDALLAQAVQAEKEGRPMPITTQIGVQFYQSQIENQKREAKLQETIQKLTQQMESLSNPQRTIDHTAYGNLDSFVRGHLDSLYGDDDGYTQVKGTQFDAITRQMGEAIRQLQADNPEEWDRIRRQPGLQKRLVDYFVKQNLPPQAIKLLEHERLKNTPMSRSELWKAFKEADGIQDVKERQEIKEKIRREILLTMHQTGKIRVQR